MRQRYATMLLLLAAVMLCIGPVQRSACPHRTPARIEPAPVRRQKTQAL